MHRRDPDMPKFERLEGAEPYREVRGLTRGLAVLRALNAMPGGVGGVVELARRTGLHRTTVKRLLETQSNPLPRIPRTGA